MYQLEFLTAAEKSGANCARTCSPLSPARKVTCKMDLSGQITRSTAVLETRVRDKAPNRLLSALANFSFVPDTAAFTEATCDINKLESPLLSSCSVMAAVSCIASSRRRPAESQNAEGFIGTSSMASTVSLISRSRFLSSSRTPSDSLFHVSGATVLFVESVAWKLAWYGLKVPAAKGRRGALSPDSLAVCASRWCASVRRVK
mmetsp:Transcript_12345/g.33977  ORF Transcript_12345/g.33977 Transcript_12345/m.33977 type:complete len:203 (-) Transcript_12345:378-986(-)